MTLPKFGFKAHELIEKHLVSQQQIDTIKNWTYQEAKLPHLTDEQISLFIIGHENDFDAIKRCIKECYALRLDSAKYFEQRSFEIVTLRNVLNVVDFCVSPVKTKDDYVIIYSRLADYDYTHIDSENCIKLQGMVLDAVAYDYPAKGVIFVYDMIGVGLMHLTVLRPRLMRIYFKLLQDCLAVPIKRVHILNSTYFVTKLMGIIKPFLNSGVFEKIHFHLRNMDMEEFYNEWVPKECLPEELGGCLPSIKVIKEATVNRLIEMEEYFEQEEQQRKCIF